MLQESHHLSQDTQLLISLDKYSLLYQHVTDYLDTSLPRFNFDPLIIRCYLACEVCFLKISVSCHALPQVSSFVSLWLIVQYIQGSLTKIYNICTFICENIQYMSVFTKTTNINGDPRHSRCRMCQPCHSLQLGCRQSHPHASKVTCRLRDLMRSD
jgi:hypothetical protein